MKEVLFNNEEYNQILAQLDQLMQDAEQISDVDHKVLLYQILQYFDSIHREPLSRIMEALQQDETLKAKILSDPTVSKLASLYDLKEHEEPTAKKDERQVAFIPESEVGWITPPKKKDWLELGDIELFQQNKLYAKNYQKVNFIISKVGSTFYAVENQCDGSFLPIDQGTLDEHVLTCPWHGCQYDLRTGESINETDKKLDTFPVEVEKDGMLKVEIAY